MCTPKRDGGKRCSAHMSGSLAAKTMAYIRTGIKESFVNKVFSDLNKEGKNLPQPTEEEIIAFARNNQFMSRHDITIPDNKRAMLIKRWQKAEMESPSGGTFHAWKHTTVETVVRWKRATAASALLVGVSFTTACGGGAIDNGNNEPVPTSSPTSISQSATPSPSASATPTIKTTPAATRGVVIPSSKGEYLQSTLADDDPAVKYNPAIVDPSATAVYSEADITEGQKFLATFMAEEGIDSGLNGDGETTDQWWERNKSKIAPEFHEDFRTNLDGAKPMVVAENWQPKVYGPKAETPEGKALSYEYVYSKDEPRVVNRKIVPTTVYATPDGSLVYGANVEYGMKTVPGERLNNRQGSGLQESTGTMTYAARKDAATGQWLLTGYLNDVNTTEG